MDRDELFMREAIAEAHKAAELLEAPIGCVIVRGTEIIARSHNLRELSGRALAHAELLAIDAACGVVGGWRLCGCELYATLEPCPMCAGACINARIDRVVFGAYDPKAGSLGTLVNLSELPYNHKPEVRGGVLEEECAALLSSFFASLRESRREKN